MGTPSRARSLLCLIASLVSLAFLTGCPSQVLTQETTVADVDEQQATCKVARDPLRPLIVEWPGTSKVELDSASQRGIVVVSYVGCTMKVLSSCSAGGQYDFTPVTPAREKVVMADQNDLYARLPLGAASLKGELAMGSSLELDYVAVGQRAVEKPPRMLSGECEGATHYVRAITVGAYSLDAKASGKVAGGVDVQGAGLGGGRSENVRRIRGSGEVEACSGSPDTASCGAVLQLSLSPLAASRGGQVTSAGFGSNIAPLTAVPTVNDLGDITQVGATSLRDVDVNYLSAVQDAKRAEKGSNTQAKIDAWIRVRDMKESGDWRQMAETRVTDWLEVKDAEQKRKAQLDKLRSQYNDDKGKLDQLLRMDDDLVSKAQKDAYQKEFTAVYAPYEKDLQEVGIGSSPSTSSSSSSSYSSTPYSSASSSDYSSGSVTDAPKVDEEIFILKAEVGGVLQGYELTGVDDSDDGTDYDLTGLSVGGQLAVNFAPGDDMAIGLKVYGHYYPNATMDFSYADDATTLPSGGTYDPSAIGFDAGAGIRLAGNIGDRVGMHLGIDAGAVGFVANETHPRECIATTTAEPVTNEFDPDAIGGGAALFWGFDFYPLQFLSVGVTALINWNHVEAQGCDVNGSGVVDFSGSQFGLQGIGSVGLHF